MTTLSHTYIPRPPHETKSRSSTIIFKRETPENPYSLLCHRLIIQNYFYLKKKKNYYFMVFQVHLIICSVKSNCIIITILLSLYLCTYTYLLIHTAGYVIINYSRRLCNIIPRAQYM